jgi:amino acid permease
LITGIRQHWRTILLYLVVSLLIAMLIAYINPHIGHD